MAEVGAELHVNSSWHAQVSPEDNVSRHALCVQKFVSPCAGPWFFEASSGVFWNETEKISMDPAAGNPNLQDVPDLQQVMIRPSVATAQEGGTEGAPRVLNGVSPPLRGSQDIDGEVLSASMLASHQNAPAETAGATPQPAVPGYGTMAATPEMTGRGTVVAPSSSTMQQAVSELQSPPTGVMITEIRGQAQVQAAGSGGVFSGVMRAVQTLPAAVENLMATSTSGRLAPEPTSLHDSVEYDSVRSFVGRAQESPPSATQVPATPLLDTATLTRMRQLQASAPLIYPEASPVPPAPRPESIASSDLQAEVRKQLMELMASRDEESRRLRAQVEALSLENQSLRLRIEADVQPGMQSSKPGVSNPTGFGGLSWLGRGLGTLMGQQRAGRVMESSSSQPSPPPPPAPPIMPQGKDPATGEYPGYPRQPLDFGVRPPGLVATQPSAFGLVPKEGSMLSYEEL